MNKILSTNRERERVKRPTRLLKHLFNSSFFVFFLLLIFSQYITPVFATTLLTDDFTGTTIDPVKWNETDAGGVGGTTGNIQQNGSLTTTGAGAWGANYVVTDATYDRSLGGLEMEADITCGATNSIFGVGYGDPGVLTGGGQSYTIYAVSRVVYLSRQLSNSNAENVSASFSCTVGVPFHIRLAIDATSGASLYINGSGTPSATVSGGTFNNKGFFLSGHSGTVTTIDNFVVNGTGAPTEPDAPTDLAATPASTQMVLTWSAPLSDGGASVTDYLVEYKLNSEPTTWTTFADGTSASTGATVTGLVNGSLYNFRVSAINSVGTGAVSSTANATPASVTMADSFTGTTIDTDKWTETDAGGVGGTVGLVQQNDSLNITTGVHAWGTQDGVRTVETYDRTNGDVSMEFSVTRTSCGTGVAVAAGYGDFNFASNGTASYIFISNTTTWQIYYWVNGVNQGGSPQTLSGITSCTNGVPTTFKIEALQAGGAKVYVNGSGTASATLVGGTFTDKPFWIGSGISSGGTSSYDDVEIIEPATGPFAPTGLTPTAGDGEVSLSWTSGGDNGASITDYLVEYKLSTAGSWSTFSDGTSATTSATVTGLTNGSLYNFRVKAVNSNGTSDPSSTANSTPLSATPTAPTATSVSVSGSASLGELLTGTYTYNDVNGNAEATSTFRWLRADSAGGTYSAISEATSINYTVTSDDLTKYLKFEVTPVSNTSPTTGTPVLSSATSQVSEIDYINQILSTGQSLSVGVASTPALTTTQPYNNLMLSGGNGGLGTGGSFIPLVEGSVETISSSMANTITANDAGNDFDVAVSLHGVSGYTYSQLKKGTGPYSKGMTQVTNAKNAAIALGRTSRVIGVTTIHGETDNFNGVSGATYQGYLEEWQNDYDTDVKAITGQSNEVILFLDQMSSFMSSYANDATSEIPIYQLYAAEENPNEIVLVAPKYFFNYSDRHHLTGASSRWLGEYYGKVIKKVVIDHETWRPLSPDSAIRSGNIIDVNFHVPAGVLAFDTTLVSARTNYGFEYYDSTSSATISSVAILDDDTVRITLSGTPTGANQRIRYAYTGVPGTNTGAQNAGSAAGNLRDTDTYPSLYGNTLYNWAVHFDEPIVLDSTAPTITNISSDKTDGTYGEGEVIDIDVTFSEAVTSTGNVTLTLETGTVDRTCTFTVSNATTGTCNYTVSGGDISSDLTVSSISGTIADQAGNAMASFTIGTNLASNKALVIDTEDSVISLLVASPANTTSTITWTTDELSSSIVDYGLTNAYGTSTVEEDTSPRVTSHSVDISSLVACTTYHFRVRSTDGASNTATGSDNTFTTTGCVGGADVLDEEASSITANTGGTLELDLGGAGLLLVIPADATADDAVYQIKQLDSTSVTNSIGTPSGFTPAGSNTFDIKSLSDNSTTVTSFNKPITITLNYNDSDISGLDESSLIIYHYHLGSWTPLSNCSVDTNLNTVTCTTTNFSIFSLFGLPRAEASRSSSGSGIHYGCKDTKALNYEYFAASNPTLCKYAVVTPINPTTEISTTIFTRDLKFGMAGDDVKALQVYLNNHSYIISSTGAGSPGKETEYFGSLTSSALARFQEANKDKVAGLINEKGFLGPITREFINSLTKTTTAITPTQQISNLSSVMFTKLLNKGIQSEDVSRLQKLLATKPEIYPAGLVTGYFGPLTEKAVQTFQLKYGVVNSKNNSGFGVVGPKTRAKLQEVFGN